MTDDTDPKTNLLTTLFSSGGDQTVKLITLALVVVTGGGNFFAAKQSAKVVDHEVNQAIREIHELHEQLTASVQRQKEIRDLLDKLTKEKQPNGP